MADPTIVNVTELDTELDLGSARIPQRLRDAYHLAKPLPNRGAEALLVQATPTAGGDDVVLKLYGRPLGRRTAILDGVSRGQPEHIVRLYDYGTDEGVGYEVLEYIGGGDLRQYLASKGGRLTEDECVEVLTELSQAIEAFHGLTSPPLAHADIKPDNILVRSRTPLDLVLADFGLATFDSSEITAHKGTPRWSDPSASSGIFEPEGDWWSLGAIMFWALTGSPILATIDDVAAVKFVQSENVPLDSLPEDLARDWARLCRGLLTRDHSQRWGHAQICEWLDGGTPSLGRQWDAPPEPVTVTVEIPRSTPTMRFLGKEYRTPESLALALAQNWDAAVRLISGRTPEIAKSLSDYAASTNDLDVAATAQQVLASEQPAERVLIELIATLAPSLKPCYRGVEIDEMGLRALASEAAANPTGTAAELVTSLAEDRTFVGWDVSGDRPLSYTGLLRQWDAAVEQWHEDVASRIPSPDYVPARSRILLALVDSTEARTLSREGQQAGGKDARSVKWFETLRNSARAQPGHAMALIQLAPTALKEARAQRASEAAAREEANRARAADSMLRTPRTARLLGWCLLIQTVMLFSWLMLRVYAPRSQDFGVEVRKVLTGDWPWQITDWLLIVSDPRVVLPLAFTSLVLWWRAQDRTGEELVARHRLERRVMQGAIATTTLAVPLMAPITAMGWARGLRRYAPDEMRRRNALRSWALVTGSMTSILAMLTILKIPPDYWMDIGWTFHGWPLGLHVDTWLTPSASNVLLSPMYVIWYADPIGWTRQAGIVILLCGPALLYLGAQMYTRSSDSIRLATWVLLLPGLIGSLNLVLAFLPLFPTDGWNVFGWIVVAILGIWAWRRFATRARR